MNTTTPQYFPPMATPMRPQAMTDPQLLDEYLEAVSDAACYLANDDHQYAREAIHYRNEYAAEIEKRGLLTPAEMRHQQEEKYREYLRMS